MVFFKWLIRFVPLFYMALIWILSGLPHNAVVELPDNTFDRFFKESMHLVGFGLLYVLLVLAFLTTKLRFTHTLSIWLAAFCCLYGVIDEIHQYFVPYRSATLIDVVKDVIGVIVSWYVIEKAYFHGRFTRVRRMLAFFERLKAV